VVDKMKRRKLKNAIRNFIRADGKSQAALTIIFFYF